MSKVTSTIDPFMLQAPPQLDEDISYFFSSVARTLHDLTALRGDAIDDVTTTEIESATVITDETVSADLSTSVENLTATLDEVIARQVLIEANQNAILAQMRLDGDIKIT